MDMISYMAEIVLVSFLVGGIMGAVIAVHLTSKPQERDVHEGEAVPVKIKVKR